MIILHLINYLLMKYITRILFCSLLITATLVKAQDTLRVMSYNVLNYGDGCQGSNARMHGYLKTIINYTNPDLLGLIKVENTPVSTNGFADSITTYALNTVFPNRYAHCTYTDVAGDNKTSLLFYDENKLAFLGVQTLVAYTSDFNLYKFYYKNDIHLSTTKDTTFLYVILNHTQSGTSSTTRDTQMMKVSNALQTKFTHLPNLINMGDFNLHSTAEAGYQTLIAPADTNYRFYDTPFYPDQLISYPALWESNAAPYAKYMTTSTRQSASLPNTCGTSGGAKDWFDHILLSPWITQNANYISYVPNSYHTVGNDNNRLGISINDSSTIKNTSAPTNVIEALYQFSNKYPVTLKLLVRPNTTGTSPADPDKTTITAIENAALQNELFVVNPMQTDLIIHVQSQLLDTEATLIICDALGREVMNQTVAITQTIITQPVVLTHGIYYLTVQTNQGVYHTSLVKE